MILRRVAARTSAGLIHFLDNALSPRLHGLSDRPSTRHTLVWICPDHPPPHRPGLCQRVEGIRVRHAQVGGGIRRPGCWMPFPRGSTSHGIQGTRHHPWGRYRHLCVPAVRHAAGKRNPRPTDPGIHAAIMPIASIFSIWPSSTFPPTATKPLAWIRWIFMQGDLSLYREFNHPQGWGRDRVRPFLSKTFKKPAAIRTILNNDPPFFTSNHAPFLIGLSKKDCAWFQISE
jgi:hypothetical protein